jgi:hypothetical protein
VHYIATMQRTLLIILLLVSVVSTAQQSSEPTKQAPKSAPSSENIASIEPEVDMQAIAKETEQLDMRRHKMGIFWWVPPDFWDATLRQQGYTSEQAHKAFEPFRNYNLFMVAIGDMGVGNISWTKEAEVKKSILLRDQSGTTYKPLEDVPRDIGPIIDLMRPIFKNMMGNFGEGLQFVVFPAKDSSGNIFADPRKRSEFSLDVADLMGPATSTYTWRLPLSSLMPPKYCPVGKEKLEAHWKYCPWHGNKLEDVAEPVKTAVPGKP